MSLKLAAFRTIMTLERANSMQYIDKLIFNYSIVEDKAEVELYRKKALKSYAYCSEGISNKEFATIYPEIKSLNDFLLLRRHKILFLMATHGLRTQVLWIFKFVRWMKRCFARNRLRLMGATL